MDTCTREIIKEMSLLDTADDGIKANQKYNYISSIFQKECTSERHLREIYRYLNEESLKDSGFAQKFAMLSASRLFQTYELFGLKAINLLNEVMGDNYENLDKMKVEYLDGFYNSIVLFGEYYHRARMSDGSTLVHLVNPLIDSFSVMLQLNTERSAKEFVAQISLNGEVINKTHPERMEDLMVLVRKRILYDENDNGSARTWLMLCVDLSKNGFREVSPKLETFYNDVLQDKLRRPEPKSKGLKNCDVESHIIEESSQAESQKNIQKNVAEKGPQNVSSLANRLSNIQLSQKAQQESQKAQYESQKATQVGVTEKSRINLEESHNASALANRLINIQKSVPTKLAANISQNTPRPINSSSNTNTNSRTSRNSCENVEKSASSDTWDLEDSTPMYYRSKSMAKTSPTRSVHKEKSCSDENFTKRNCSPIRFPERKNNENTSSGYTKHDSPLPRYDARARHDKYSAGFEKRDSHLSQSGYTKRDASRSRNDIRYKNDDYSEGFTKREASPPRNIRSINDNYSEGILKGDVSPPRNVRSRNDNYSEGSTKRDVSPPRNIGNKNDNYSEGSSKRDASRSRSDIRFRNDNYSEGYTKQDVSRSQNDIRSRNDNYSEGYTKRDVSPPQNDRSKNYLEKFTDRASSPPQSENRSPRYDARSRYNKYSEGFDKSDSQHPQYDNRSKNDNSPPRQFDKPKNDQSGGFKRHDAANPRYENNRSRNENYSDFTKRDTSPPRFKIGSKNDNYSGGDFMRSKKENRNFLRRDTSPPSFDTGSRNENGYRDFSKWDENSKFDLRLCRDQVIKAVESNLQSENGARKLPSPRERATFQRPKQRESTNEYDNYDRNDSQESYNHSHRTNVQNRKATKAYLHEQNVENLTWTNGDKEIQPRKNNFAPRFSEYLRRN